MKDRSNYVFGAALAGVALGGVPGVLNRASAAVITQAAFTFETSAIPVNSTNVTAATYGPLVAESGTGSAYGVHTSTATVYSSPSGNGSARSFSANHWSAGDYYEFTVPTTGISNVLLSFDALSSSTGPKAFNLLYSTDGTTFSTFTNYAIYSGTVPTGTTTGTASYFWASSASYSQYNLTYDLSAITALNNNSNAIFEMVDTDTTTAVAGTSRLDNVIVSGSAIPEPAALSLLSVAAAATMFRRRKPS